VGDIVANGEHDFFLWDGMVGSDGEIFLGQMRLSQGGALKFPIGSCGSSERNRQFPLARKCRSVGF
jgi:hypothetical protein